MILRMSYILVKFALKSLGEVGCFNDRNSDTVISSIRVPTEILENQGTDGIAISIFF